jgi:hypothetical protein
MGEYRGKNFTSQQNSPNAVNYNAPSQGHQGQPEHLIIQSSGKRNRDEFAATQMVEKNTPTFVEEEEDDEGDSIFIKKWANSSANKKDCQFFINQN